MNYTSVLKKYNLESNQVSTSIKNKIAQITKLDSDIKKVSQMLEQNDLSAKKRETMQADLETAKTQLEELDEKLCQSIERWYPNREQYAARGQAMQAGRKAKKNGAVNKNIKAEEVATKPVVTNNVSAPTNSSPAAGTEKKGMGTWKWVGIAALAAIATVVGINMHNSSGR